MSELKKKVAKAALEYIEEDMVVGVGTGSTINFFIKELVTVKHKIDACVSSSKATEALLRAEGIPVIDLNSVSNLPIYIDGADEVTEKGEMIKGGGGALTREKIVAEAADKFICIADKSKLVPHLGNYPIAVEVIPMARSMVARKLVQLGGDPEYRNGFITDNGNIILDIFNLVINEPRALEASINQLTGVIENGLFAHRLADEILIASDDGVNKIIVLNKSNF